MKKTLTLALSLTLAFSALAPGATKISALAPDTAPSPTDVVPTVKGDGSPGKKVQLQDLIKWLSNVSKLTFDSTFAGKIGKASDVYATVRTGGSGDGLSGSGRENDPVDVSTSAKFQSLLTALPAGATIHVAPGTYPSMTLTISKSVKITGPREAIFTPAVGTGNQSIFVLSGVNTDFTLQGVSLVHGDVWRNEAGIPSAIRNTSQVRTVRLLDVYSSDFNNTVRADAPMIELEVRGSKFLYTHGRSGISNSADGGGVYSNPCASIVGNPIYRLIVKGNYFDGLVDPSFSGLTGSPPSVEKAAADNFVQTSAHYYADISDNTVLNHDIEGCYVSRGNGTGITMPSPAITVNTSSGSATITKTAGDNFTQNDFNLPVAGAGIPTGAKIQTITDTTHAVLVMPDNVTPANATATATGVSATVLNRDRYFYSFAHNYIAGVRGANGIAPYAGGYSPGIVVDNARCEIVGNTINGSVQGVELIFTDEGSTVNEATHICHVDGNVITNVIRGVEGALLSSKATFCGNTIHTSSEPFKTTYAPGYFSFQEMIGLLIDTGTVSNSTISSDEPIYDGSYTLNSRSGTNGQVFALTSASGIVNASQGALIAYANNSVQIFPVISVSGNNVTVQVDFAGSYPTPTSGTLFYQKYSANPQNAAGITANGGTVYADGNTIIGHRYDFQTNGGASAFVISKHTNRAVHAVQPNGALFTYTVAPGAANISGTSTLGSQFNMTAASDTSQDSGLAVTLPTPGTYRVVANLPYQCVMASGTFGEASAFLYNSTDGAEVANSRRLLFSITSGRSTGTLTITSFVTVTAPKTIKVYAVRFYDGTWTNSLFYADAGSRGVSQLSYERINPQ
jgi:hypothetical protein